MLARIIRLLTNVVMVQFEPNYTEPVSHCVRGGSRVYGQCMMGSLETLPCSRLGLALLSWSLTVYGVPKSSGVTGIECKD